MYGKKWGWLNEFVDPDQVGLLVCVCLLHVGGHTGELTLAQYMILVQ